MEQNSTDGTKAQLRLLPSGPLLIEGQLSIEMGDGTIVDMTKAALCRCGASKNKPFCDGAHAEIGFEG